VEHTLVDKPSVLIIVFDALRADCTPLAADSPHLRAAGLKRPDLPSFTRLVQGMNVFTQTFACASYTSACHASLFTGLLTPEHGVRAFYLTSLSPEVRTLAEILLGDGYATCAMSDQPIMFESRNLLRGFQTFVNTEDEALAWWDSYESVPRFLFMHIWDMHQPYNMPFAARYRGGYAEIVRRWEETLQGEGLPVPPRENVEHHDPERYRVSLMQSEWMDSHGYRAGLSEYIAGLTNFDAGRLHNVVGELTSRRMLENNIVVITADHGDGRGPSHEQRVQHGTSLLDDQIHIPFYLRLPATSNNQLVAEQVSQADIAPTILDHLGLLSQRTEPVSEIGGRSVLPLLSHQPLPERPVYSEIHSRLQRQGSAADPVVDLDLEAIPENLNSAAVRFRTLRYPECKYWLVGQAGAFPEEDLLLPPEQFVHALFRIIAGRPPSETELRTWLQDVAAVAGSDAQARRALAERFETSGQFRTLPKYAIYDLRRDPLETRPVDARLKTADWEDYQAKLDMMLYLDREARQGAPLVTNEADEQIVLKRLADLGYVE
jgi:arylsulfatase A-like enzyme